MASGAGDTFSRRRWDTMTYLLSSLAYVFLFYCSSRCLLVCVFWSKEGRRSRRMIRGRREWRLFGFVFPAVLSLHLAAPAMSREDSLAAALFGSWEDFPDEPSSGYRWSSRAVDSVIALQSCKEYRFQQTISITLSPGRVETNKPPCSAPAQQTGTRFKDITSSAPSLLGRSSSFSSFKVIFSSHVWVLPTGSMVPRRRNSSGDLPIGTVERLRSAVSCHALTVVNGLMYPYVWAWPICVFKIVIPRICSPRPNCVGENLIQRLMAFGSVSFRSSSSCEDKTSPSYPLPMERDVPSDSFRSVCFSLLITLLPCVAVCTEPEGASKTISVILVDEVWTPTSHYVTIFKLFDFVVRALPTHSSTVLDPLSSLIEDLSCLASLTAVVYAYCQRG